MSFERYSHAIPDGGDHVGTERQVGDELAVHHVPLDEVDAGLLECDDLVTEAEKSAGTDGAIWIGSATT